MTTLSLPRVSSDAVRIRTAFVALALVVCTHTRAHAQGTGTIATAGLTPGWATFGEAVPQGQATSGLKIGTLPTQTDVKNRWPDGSIKFAIVSANVSTAGNYAVTAASTGTGVFAPSVPIASVTLMISGVAYVATLPTTVSAEVWLSG